MSEFRYHDSMIYALSELAEYQAIWEVVWTQVLNDVNNVIIAVSHADDPEALAKIADNGDPRYIERFKSAYGIPTISSLEYDQQGSICALLTERGRPYSKAFLDALADPAAFDLTYYIKDAATIYADYGITGDEYTMTVDVLVDSQNSAVRNAVYDLYRRILPIEFDLLVHCPYVEYGWFTTDPNNYHYGDLAHSTYQDIREGIIREST